ncbi:MAG TPA: choice-of-anchor A family protein [Myxococcaceae bacterium]
MKGPSIFSAALLALSLIGCGLPETEGSLAPESQQAERAALSGDTTPPVSSTELEPNASPEGTYYGNVSITITATDASGVESITWAMSGATTRSGTAAGNVAYLPIITRVGRTTVTFYAKDLAGNYEVAQTIHIDRVPPPVQCPTVKLNDFNLFVTGDYTGGHDVRGKVVAGGNIELTHFSVGADLAATDLSNVLVAGGELNISNGGIFGNAHYGTSTTADGTTTFYRGALYQGGGLNIGARAIEVATLSSQLAAQTANGTTTVTDWGGIYLQGGHAKMNVFTVNASAFTNAVFLSISAPVGSMVVVNVRGSTARFANFGHSYSGVDHRSILFNFPQASNITAFNYGFWGTVLAPNAHIDFNNGSWDGGIYAASFSGNAEGHVNPLRDFEFCSGGVGQ